MPAVSATALRDMVVTCVTAAIGFGLFYVGASVGHAFPSSARYSFLADSVPLAHHVPQYPGGLSFRFAMAHDVIHERFPRHGREHYERRNEQVRRELSEANSDPSRWLLMDDLGAGLDRVGRSDEAVALLRTKLEEQQDRGVSGRDLYTSFANLGTFLIHANFRRAMAAETQAVDRFREGVQFIRQSVEVNPEAHFGRERWQAAIAEFLLASMENPELLREFDCIGNRLDTQLASMIKPDGANLADFYYGRAVFGWRTAQYDVPVFFESDADPSDESQWEQLSGIREYITEVGAEPGWSDVPVPSHRKPVPFDEPMLGIIGMWRQGGGANPHFALAIGETMLRVGQRYIAWTAFARARMLAERYSPDPETRAFLVQHCTARMRDINESFPPEAVPKLRVFEDELAMGQEYQAAMQAFEEARVNAGDDPSAENFFDAFRRERGPIASEPGPEELHRLVRRSRRQAYVARDVQSKAIFGAGIGAIVPFVLRWLLGLIANPWRALRRSVSRESAERESV